MWSQLSKMVSYAIIKNGAVHVSTPLFYWQSWNRMQFKHALRPKQLPELVEWTHQTRTHGAHDAERRPDSQRGHSSKSTQSESAAQNSY
jgi:hypothetical protein